MFVVDARRASVDEGPTRETLVDNPRRRASDSDDRGVSMDARAPARGSTGRAANVEVMIRVRPALRRELEGVIAYQRAVAATRDGTACAVSAGGERALTGDESFVYDETSTSFKDAAHGMSMDDDGRAPRSHEFGFDAVYDERASQEEVYARSAKPAVLNALRGYNATVLAYGQTGTGKTYTMEGDRGTMLAYGQQRFGLPGDAPATDGACLLYTSPSPRDS